MNMFTANYAIYTGSRSQHLSFLANAIVRPPVVCSLYVTFVRPTQAIEIFRNVSSHLVPWPSVTFRQKFYGDRPRGTPPSGELNTRGVAEYSDFGLIERYISETVQDRS